MREGCVCFAKLAHNSTSLSLRGSLFYLRIPQAPAWPNNTIYYCPASTALTADAPTPTVRVFIICESIFHLDASVRVLIEKSDQIAKNNPPTLRFISTARTDHCCESMQSCCRLIFPLMHARDANTGFLFRLRGHRRILFLTCT